MKDLFSVDFRDAIRKVVKKELKDKFGIKISKEKGKTVATSENSSKYFGIPLEDVPSRTAKDEEYFKVPIILIDTLEYLNAHLKVEGLFRKSGSVGRQKVLREILEKDGTCCSCDFVQPHDIASLVKQFFRELPDPLLTRKLSASFIKCIGLQKQNDCISATALCCLLLPDEHLRVLKYFVDFIAEMANHSLESKMTLSNLAIIFAPNLTNATLKDKNGEKSMKECTQVVDLLFKNSHLIGMVPDVLFNKALTMSQEGGCCSSSGDELDAGDEPQGRGRTLQRSDKKRDRSKSITGFLRRNFKANEKSGTTVGSSGKHVRSRTCEKPSSAKSKDNLLQVPPQETRTSSIKEFGEPVWKKQDSETRPVKRRNNSKTNMSPVRKSPRLGAKELQQSDQHQATPPVISLPKLKSMPNQVASTPRRLLQPIHNQDIKSSNPAPLPSKFEIPTNSSKKPCPQSQHQREIISEQQRPKPRLPRSKSSTLHHTSLRSPANKKHGKNNISPHDSTTNDQQQSSPTTVQHHQQQPLQPKLSRATQKPHVRKTRRASSLDRRRARYASASQRIRRQLPKIPNQKGLEDSTISNISFSCDDIATSISKMENLAFCESTSCPNIQTPENHTSKSSTEPSRARRRLPKATSSTVCSSPVTNTENMSPVTPENRKIRRSNTSIRKPATPYSVTPQIGTRRNAQGLTRVGTHKPLVL